MKVGDKIIRKRNTIAAEAAGWKKEDTIVKIEGIMYTLESGNIFPESVLKNLYDSLEDDFILVKPNETTGQ